MNKSLARAFVLSLCVLGSLTAQEPGSCRVQEALQGAPADVRAFHEHVTFLANPFLGGRLPGTPGMEIARAYVQHHFERAGLEPAFTVLGQKSWRQPFKIGSNRKITSQSMKGVTGQDLVPEVDFRSINLGGAGAITAPVVFAGYGIASGPEGWQGYEEGDSLEGKIALILRFEPLNAEGGFRFGRDGQASRYGDLRRKVRALSDLKPAAILIANPPGAKDERANSLMEQMSGGRAMTDAPVLAISNALAEAIVQAGAPDGVTFTSLRERADAGRVLQPLSVELSLEVQVDEGDLFAENVGGVVPGRGMLADQIVVVGGHIDHLGMGRFGSRDRAAAGRAVHPGADDNATGAAGIIMMAETWKKHIATLPEDTPYRTVLFIGFDAEEQGLLGASHYLKDPIMPKEAHSLMINFDMIGRLTENKIAVQGLDSAKGLEEILEPVLAATPLEVVKQGVIPASDHYPFYSQQIPILFSICHSISAHPDYHTSRDTADRINFRAGTEAVRLYDAILATIAKHPDALEFTGRAGGGRRTR